MTGGIYPRLPRFNFLLQRSHDGFTPVPFIHLYYTRNYKKREISIPYFWTANVVPKKATYYCITRLSLSEGVAAGKGGFLFARSACFYVSAFLCFSDPCVSVINVFLRSVRFYVSEFGAPLCFRVSVSQIWCLWHLRGYCHQKTTTTKTM